MCRRFARICATGRIAPWVRSECAEVDSSGRRATDSNNVVLQRYCTGCDLANDEPVRVGPVDRRRRRNCARWSVRAALGW